MYILLLGKNIIKLFCERGSGWVGIVLPTVKTNSYFPLTVLGKGGMLSQLQLQKEVDSPSSSRMSYNKSARVLHSSILEKRCLLLVKLS